MLINKEGPTQSSVVSFGGGNVDVDSFGLLISMNLTFADHALQSYIGYYLPGTGRNLGGTYRVSA